MKPTNASGAAKYALDLLEKNLPDTYFYHSRWHTACEIVPMTEKLARMEAVDPESTMLLITAAWYHDIGFTITRAEHEEASCKIASEILPRFDYTEEQIEKVRDLIMATVFPQSPQNHHQMIIADADLKNLGTDTFFDRSNDLRRELAAEGTMITDLEWYTNQINLITAQKFYTKSARMLFNTKLEENLMNLKEIHSHLMKTGKKP